MLFISICCWNRGTTWQQNEGNIKVSPCEISDARRGRRQQKFVREGLIFYGMSRNHAFFSPLSQFDSSQQFLKYFIFIHKRRRERQSNKESRMLAKANHTMHSCTVNSVSCHAKKYKRRFCRVPDCQRTVKSQGLCQRHGAKPCKCKVAGCEKQAQGSFMGMCKAHFRQVKLQESNEAVNSSPPAISEKAKSVGAPKVSSAVETKPPILGKSIPSVPTMTLFETIKRGYINQKGAGWRRMEERVIRGFAKIPVEDAFESWELELLSLDVVAMQMTSEEALKYLSYAWGRNEDFYASIFHRFRSEHESNANYCRETSQLYCTSADALSIKQVTRLDGDWVRSFLFNMILTNMSKESSSISTHLPSLALARSGLALSDIMVKALACEIAEPEPSFLSLILNVLRS